MCPDRLNCADTEYRQTGIKVQPSNARRLTCAPVARFERCNVALGDPWIAIGLDRRNWGIDFDDRIGNRYSLKCGPNEGQTQPRRTPERCSNTGTVNHAR